MKSKIGIITQREFFTQVKKRTFIIMTFLAPFLIIGAGLVIGLMMNINRNSKTKIAVIDKSELFQKSLKSNEKIEYLFYQPEQEKQILDTIKDSKFIQGLLVIPKPIYNDYKNIEDDSKIFTNTSLGIGTEVEIEESLVKELETLKLKKLGIDPKALDSAKSKVVFSIKNVKDGTEESSNSFLKMGISVFLLTIIYTFILVYGMRVMRSVMEEKSNRVIEIIISSVKPFDLMMGKIFGTTLVAFFQFAIWIFLALVFGSIAMSIITPEMGNPNMVQAQLSDKVDLQKIQEDMAPIMAEISQLNFPFLLGVFLFYFVFGYLFYSSILASIGAAVDSETETQQFMPFILIPLMLGFYGSIMIFENPEGPVGTWLSIIPITSPLAMVARIPFGVPTWQLITSMILLVISVFIMVKISAQVYRIGILMFGQKISLKEVWKWIRKGY